MGPLAVFVLGGVTAMLAKDTLAKVAQRGLGEAILVKRKIERAAAAAVENAQDAVAEAEKGVPTRIEQKPS